MAVGTDADAALGRRRRAQSADGRERRRALPAREPLTEELRRALTASVSVGVSIPFSFPASAFPASAAPAGATLSQLAAALDAALAAPAVGAAAKTAAGVPGVIDVVRDPTRPASGSSPLKPTQFHATTASQRPVGISAASAAGPSDLQIVLYAFAGLAGALLLASFAAYAWRMTWAAQPPTQPPVASSTPPTLEPEQEQRRHATGAYGWYGQPQVPQESLDPQQPPSSSPYAPALQYPVPISSGYPAPVHAQPQNPAQMYGQYAVAPGYYPTAYPAAAAYRHGVPDTMQARRAAQARVVPFAGVA
jgi:hypothetical protein